ncbi:MAG: hypothetical protein RL754_656 [Bacteroidota bacterium]|jgi:hypothetical protein
MDTVLQNPLADLFLRFALTMMFNMVQLRIVTKNTSERKDHLYSFVIISVVVFFLSHALSSFNMQLGMAIGMFAVFGIVRYRTETLKPEEMTYLFSAIGIAVINALAEGMMGYTELVGINLLVLAFIYVLEKFYLVEAKGKLELKKLSITIPVTDLSDEAIAAKVEDLRTNLKLDIINHQISKVDYALGTAQITVFYAL